MTEPNMTARQLEQWTRTEAFAEYKRRHPNKDVDAVVRRAKRVIRGRASESEVAKVESFISRMKANRSGQPVNGSGPTAVSDRTASLRNWGFDPTGRFS